MCHAARVPDVVTSRCAVNSLVVLVLLRHQHVSARSSDAAVRVLAHKINQRRRGVDLETVGVGAVREKRKSPSGLQRQDLRQRDLLNHIQNKSSHFGVTNTHDVIFFPPRRTLPYNIYFPFRFGTV